MTSNRLSARATLLVPALGLLLACGGDSFDSAQVPIIRITPVIALPIVAFAWTPDGAQQVRVYKGTVATGNFDQLMWSITGTGQNSLVSGIEYGSTSPKNGVVDQTAKPLVPGQPYTVQISRVDPKGGANGGLTANGARYQNTQTFELATIVVAP